MPDPEAQVGGNKISGNTQITLNLKAVIVIAGLIISLGGTIFGVVNSKLSNLNDEINTLEEKVDGYNNTVTSVQSQNVIILQHYGIDIEVEAEEAARARRENDGRPASLGGHE